MRKAHNDWMSQRRDTCWPARPAWDPVTVYAAIVGTEAAQMWEEKGTDRVNENGDEDWDKGTTKYNEVHLWFTNDSKKQETANIINKMLCEGKNVSNAVDKKETFLY